jgi:hypothetical protein
MLSSYAVQREVGISVDQACFPRHSLPPLPRFDAARVGVQRRHDVRVLPLRHTGKRYRPEISLYGPLDVHFIKLLLDGCIGRVAVGEIKGEFQLADTGVEGFCLQYGTRQDCSDCSSDQRCFLQHFVLFSLWLLVDLLEVARPPGLVEKRLGRAVEPQQGKPALARNGAQIIRLRRPLGKFWAEIKVNRSVIIIFQLI